jgi:hypothetical protein
MAQASKVSVHRFTHPLRLATFCQTIPNHRTPPIPRFRPDLFFDHTRNFLNSISGSRAQRLHLPSGSLSIAHNPLLLISCCSAPPPLSSSSNYSLRISSHSALPPITVCFGSSKIDVWLCVSVFADRGDSLENRRNHPFLTLSARHYSGVLSLHTQSKKGKTHPCKNVSVQIPRPCASCTAVRCQRIWTASPGPTGLMNGTCG